METKFKETKIGRIPEEWGIGKIEDVVVKSSTRNPKKKPLEEFKYVDISSVSNVNYSIREHETMPGKDAPSRAQKEIRAQDILCATVRPYLKRIAIVPNHLDGEICSTGFCVVRCKEQSADYRFVFYILQMDWMTNKLTDLQRGSSYPAITDGDVFGQYIPLPPIPEQRKIAEILSTVDETIEKTDATIQETQQLKKGLMQKLFTEGIGHTRFKETKIGRIPEDWEIIRLGNISKFQNGYAFNSSHYTEEPNNLTIIRMSNITKDGRLDISPSRVKYFPHSKLESVSSFLLEKGDLIIAMTDMSREMGIIGHTAIVDCNNKYLLNQRVGKIIPDESIVDKSYLHVFTNANTFIKYIKSTCAGAVQVNVNTSDIKKALIPLPNLSEQRRIAKIISEVDAKIEKERAFKTELEQLKKGLMQVLLTGKVRVKV